MLLVVCLPFDCMTMAVLATLLTDNSFPKALGNTRLHMDLSCEDCRKDPDHIIAFIEACG